MENLELSQRTGERPEPYRCVWDRFVDVCNRHVNLPAIIVATGVRTSTLNESMSYSELHLYASRLARWLEQSHDIGRGSRIATLLPIGMDGGLIFWAAMRLQATFIPINAVLRKVEHEFIAILNDLKPDLIISDNGGDIHGLPSLAKILSVGDLWAQIGLAGDDHCPNCLLDDVEWGSTAEAADPAICFLTSGTSSTPKACIHSQLSLSSAALAHKGSRCVQPNDLLCQQMPQFHAYGFSMSLAFWLAGGTVVFPSPSFDASASVEAINNYACTTIAAVPTMIHALTNYIATATAKPTSVRSIDIAGSVVHKEVLQSCFDSLGARKVAPSYGMTECPSVLATTDHDIDRTVPAKDEIASSGCPTPGVTAKICAVGSRKAVPIGENGVLHLSGPTVVSGYVGDREPEAFYQDASSHWIVTGDQAQMDATGRVYIVGRYKDLIISGGENISPLKVERVLESCEGVNKSYVVGLPDEIEGEVVAAVVERSELTLASTHDLQNAVAENLGSSSTPKIVLDLEHDLHQQQVPQTGSGKVKKNELRQIVSDALRTRRDTTTGEGTTASTGEKLRCLRAQVLFRDPVDLSLNASLENEVDSLNSIRFCSLVGRQMKKRMTVQDLRHHTTIATQAQLLDSREARMEQTQDGGRTGPPGLNDVCFAGSHRRLQECREKANECLKHLGLDWQSDVQDIMPVNPWGQVLLKRLRSQSWNHRHAYYAPNSNADTMERAMRSTLKQHDMLRTMAIHTTDNEQYHIVIRPGSKWFKQMIRTGFRVKTSEELKQLQLDDPDVDFAASPGPLFCVSIAAVDTGGTGIIVNGNHSCFDALAIEMFLEDLDLMISKECGKDSISPLPRHSFKSFADALSSSRESDATRAQTKQAASRLQGISGSSTSLWPEKRACEWFKGNDFGWCHSDGRPGKADERPKLNEPETAGVYGVSRSMDIPDTKRRDSFTPQVLFKAALALFNMVQTLSFRALFCQFEAGRHWPAYQGSTAESELPDPMNIAGPTYQAVISKNELRPDDTIKTFLKRLQKEQEYLSSEAHTPLDAIKAELRKDAVSGQNDADMVDDLLRRQVFNWLPPTRQDFKEIQVVQITSRSDVGILWNFRAESGKVSVNASYDDAQLKASEVSKAIGVLFRIARYLIDHLHGEGSLLETMQACMADPEFQVSER